MEIAVIGGGSWGTALAHLLGEKGYNVSLWARRKEVVEEITVHGTNKNYLASLHISKNVKADGDLEKVIDRKQLIVLAVPSHAVAETVELFKKAVAGSIIVNVAKGLDQRKKLRLSQVIQEKTGLSTGNIAVLSGPNHAEEVSQKKPSATVIAAPSASTAQFVQDVFMTPFFRVYTNPDLVGVELAGALKNVIAIGAGICDGLQLGDNAKATLVTRGLVEITRLGINMGAQASTFSGLAGIGDLFVTCSSRHSRNRYVGEMLGQGNSLKEILSKMQMIAEGVKTTRIALDLSLCHKVEMPITRQVFRILFEGATPQEAIKALMGRGKTHEIEDTAFSR